MGLSDSIEEQNKTDIEYLKRDNKVLCENLTNREFQIISLCGIVGVDAEEHLEAAVKKLIVDNKELKRRAKIIKIGNLMPPDFATLERTTLIIDLSKPENAYHYGWEAAILECGEILSK